MEALRLLRESGKAGTQREVILSVLTKSKEGYTRRELARRTQLDLMSVCGRVNELMKSNCITEIGRRQCRITGKVAYIVAANT